MADNHKYTLLGSAGLNIPVSDADKLLSAADGNAALLYLYMLRTDDALDIATAAKKLMRTEEEIRSAVGLLGEMGFLSPAKAAPSPRSALLPPEELPEYSVEDVVVRTENDRSFKAVLSETQRIFGRMLSGTELKTLFGIYDYLGMPAEVIIVLINHCVEYYRARTSSGRLPTMRSIEKEAYVWANREIITLERAEEHIRRKAEQREQLYSLRKILGMTDRSPSTSELRYMEAWIDMGFPTDSIEIAYDRTVTNTGKLSWKYMDTIIKSWHEKKLRTPEEILKGDGRKKTAAKPAVNRQQEISVTRDDIERMRKMREKIRNEQG